jgi:hypothetical protein
MRLGLGVLSLWVLLAALLLAWRGAHFSSSLSPLARFSLPSADCPAPCWAGIRPAAQTPVEIEARLAALPNGEQVTAGAETYWRFRVDGGEARVYAGQTSLALYPTPLTLGEVLLAFGSPDYQTLNLYYELMSGQSLAVISLYYEEEQAVWTLLIPAEGRLTAHSRVETLRYPTRYFAQPYYSHTWTGLPWAQALKG